MFLFFERFYFLVAKIFNPTNPAKCLHKRLLSDGYKSHWIYRKFSDEEP